MNYHYTYFLILLGSLIGPLLLSFDKKVAFYKKWLFVFGAMILPALFYIVWDIWFTQSAIWSFNPDYIVGVYFFNLPIEEVLFFFVVPYCCVFIYECVAVYLPHLNESTITSLIFVSLAIALIAIGLFNYEKAYTFYTFLFCGVTMLLIYFLNATYQLLLLKRFLISYLIILIPFLLVNGLLTAIPVVKYSNQQNLHLRIGSIPVEDVIYGMLLIMMNIVIFERLRARGKKV